MRFVDWTHDFHTCCMQTAVMNREEKPIYAYTYIQMYVYIHVYVCIYTCQHIYIHICKHICRHACMHIKTYKYMHTCNVLKRIQDH